MRALVLLSVAITGALAAPDRSRPRDAHPHPVAEVAANDNRVAAGVRHGDTVEARLTLRLARWAPEGPQKRMVQVPVLVEEGRAPTIPAPLLRVRTGTVMKIHLRNALADSTVRIIGLWPHPYASGDTVRLAPGAERDFVFAAGAPGTYLYGARFSSGAPGAPESETAVGAFVVDSAGPVPPDRVFVINIWSDSTGNALAMNGMSWPGTERIQAQVGDTLRWRIVNASVRPHPMHLHGFYFTLLSKGDARQDTTFAPDRRLQEVTDRMRNQSTYTMQWTPDRPGNWLYHCHIAFHVIPEAAQLMAPDSTHDETHSANADEHMRGLIVGINVAPARGAVAERRRDVRRIRMEVVERTPRPDHRPRMEYVLDGAPRADTTYRGNGPVLLLAQGQPTDVTVVNRLHEPTSVHWHGIELESYSDGVAGWSGAGTRTASMIAPRDSFTAHLSVPRAGTFIYHTHLGDLKQLTSGLHGALVVVPRGATFDATRDHVLLTSVDGPEDLPFLRVNGDSVPAPIRMRVGETHRLRFVNILPATDLWWVLSRDTTLQAWQPAAKDGADLPPAMRAARPSRIRVAVGETYDALFTPTDTGTFRLRTTPDLKLPGLATPIVVTK